MRKSSEAANATGNSDATSEAFEMRKRIGLWGGVALTTGAIVGTGIFVSPVGVLRAVDGSVGLSLLIWVACGLIAMMSALCYCELATAFGASGSDYNNFKLAYGPVVSFVYAWTNFMELLGNAASCQIFSRYLLVPFFALNCHPPESAIKIFAILLLFVLTYLNCKSVDVSVGAEIVFAVAKFLAMLVIGFGGVVLLARGCQVGLYNFNHAFTPDDLSQIGVPNIAQAFYQGLFPYNGWAILTIVTEEIRDMKRNLPRACVLSVFSVICIYMFVNVGYFSVLSVDEILSTKAVGVVFANKVMGPFAWFIPLAVCLSSIGNQNGSLFTKGRYPFVAARAGHMPKILAMIHVHHYTPVPGLLANCLVAIVYVLIGDFDTLIYAFGFTSWVFYGLSAASVLVLRRTMPRIARPYKVPWPIPVAVSVISTGFVAAPFIQRPDAVFAWPLAYYAIVLLGYFAFIRNKWTVPGFGAATRFLQKILKVAETDWQGFAYKTSRAKE